MIVVFDGMFANFLFHCRVTMEVTQGKKNALSADEIAELKRKKKEKKLEKKRKRAEQASSGDMKSNPGGCHFFMSQKGRFCSVSPKPGMYMLPSINASFGFLRFFF
jgi:hypothetical protein